MKIKLLIGFTLVLLLTTPLLSARIIEINPPLPGPTVEIVSGQSIAYYLKIINSSLIGGVNGAEEISLGETVCTTQQPPPKELINVNKMSAADLQYWTDYYCSRLAPSTEKVATQAKTILPDFTGNNWNVAHLIELYDWMKNNVSYDYPKMDLINKNQPTTVNYPLQTLNEKKGVCSDQAILITKFAESISASAKVVMPSDSDSCKHVFAAVYIAPNKSDYDIIKNNIFDYYKTKYNRKIDPIWRMQESDESYWIIVDPAGGNYVGDVLDGCKTNDWYPLDCSKASKGTSVMLSKTHITAEGINQILKEKNSAAGNTGEYFIRYGTEYGIDPLVALGFFNAESSMGTKGIALQTRSIGNNLCSDAEKNNPEKCYHSTNNGKDYYYKKYSSWEEGIKSWYNMIKNGNNYVTKGRTTIESIVPTYVKGKDAWNLPSSELIEIEEYIKNVKSILRTYGDWCQTN